MKEKKNDRMRWKKPHVQVAKINQNAAIDKIETKMSVWVIVRDYKGNVLKSMCTIKSFVIDPIIVEAVTWWKAVEFWSNMRIQRVLIIEGDTLEIMHPLWYEGVILNVIPMSLLCSSKNNVAFKITIRSKFNFDQ
jgi:hypothetical protein